MGPFFERFAVRAATIDELLSDAYEALPGEKSQANVAAQRLAAWCRSSASGNWNLFFRRLAKDDLSLEYILPRFAAVRLRQNAPCPSWVSDALWIKTALASPASTEFVKLLQTEEEPLAFEHLFAPVAEAAQKLLWTALPSKEPLNLAKPALACLYHDLVKQLSDLASPALYELFTSSSDVPNFRRDASDPPKNLTSTQYNLFAEKMRTNGFTALFESKPVLLRLIASLTRQWIDATTEFITRLNSDWIDVRHGLLGRKVKSLVVEISSGLGDRHNKGRSVQLIRFEDGSRILYKPKDLRPDVLWSALIEQLNKNNAPCFLQTARVLARDGYGWSEFIDHAECRDWKGVERFFRRTGAWLCLFHVFAATDMHEENMIASADQPVPIDLETLLQPTELGDTGGIIERHAFELAGRRIADSIIDTNFLPAYGRSHDHDNDVIAHGGLHSPEGRIKQIAWKWINTDLMEPVQQWQSRDLSKNMPSCNGERAKLASYIESLAAGYKEYADFMLRYRHTFEGHNLFQPFTGVRVRKLLRPTRFYSLLLERLKDHRNMHDGVEWSANLDFICRLMDWDKPQDPWWPLLRAERLSLSELNVPYFTSSSDRDEIADMNGLSTRTGGQPGLVRARSRYEAFDQGEINWQHEVLRVSTQNVLRVENIHGVLENSVAAENVNYGQAVDVGQFVKVAADIVSHFSEHAIRSGPGAAWIGLDWIRNSSVCQLSPLGPDLYNGASGISVFLAAYAKLTGDHSVAQLAIAGLTAVRQNLRSINAGRFARALGLGGATGLGSVVYALVVISALLNDGGLLDDAVHASSLFSDELIAADTAFDVMEGSAGAILGLLKLYRATGNKEVLQKAESCGYNLLKKRNLKTSERGKGLGWGVGKELNGISHGAAGFALSFATLAGVTAQNEFFRVSRECIEFENSSFSGSRGNWPDFRKESFETETFWPCQWCHGAGGIGLSRIGIFKRFEGSIEANHTPISNDLLLNDVRRSIYCVEDAWPYPSDTLCCGSLGNIELLHEAAPYVIGKKYPALREEAIRRMAAIITAAHSQGDYRWVVGNKRFNLGLFQGMAGIGYTLLRRIDRELPNLLFWE
jgi:type 2 lantibiotic biosynthesis protein LanM